MSRVRSSFVAVLALASLLVMSAAQGAPVTGGSVGTGPNTGGHALLTFDDCPYAPWTAHFRSARTANATTPATGLHNFEAVIDVAERAGVALVVAPTGLCRARYLSTFHVDIADYARRHGMWVIGHSYDHPRYTSISDDALARQVRRSVAAYWSRPPYGAYDAHVGTVMRRQGHAPWNWTFTTRDWTGLAQQVVVARVVRGCTSGQTCLMHMQWNGFNAQAVGDMVRGMSVRGTAACALQRAADGTVRGTAVSWHQLECAEPAAPPAA